MKYTKNYQFKKPDSDDAYDIQNENDNMCVEISIAQ